MTKFIGKVAIVLPMDLGIPAVDFDYTSDEVVGEVVGDMVATARKAGLSPRSFVIALTFPDADDWI